jgi:predicted RNA polymerase sigma factor
VLARRTGDFPLAEDAVQEALLAASSQWPGEGVPANPRGWLVQVASRRSVEVIRNETARRRREDAVAAQVPPAERSAPPADADTPGDSDDTLLLLFLCCSPVLPPASATALTLRSVGGLTTAQIAAAFLVPESTMAQRISRAKQTLKASGEPFRMPGAENRPGRLDAVLRVLYLMFTEGHTSTSGTDLHRPDLAREAIRLTRLLHGVLPGDPEVTGLLALMLLTVARSPARSGPDGALIPLAEQDRSRWDGREIAEGVDLLTGALRAGRVGPYQLQAAIAAVHDEAPTAADTDWPQILALYSVLARISDSPVVELNRAVAVAMVHGTAAGLDTVRSLESDPRLAERHRLHAVRAHLMQQAGDGVGAAAEYRVAAELCANQAERDYLRLRAARLADAECPGNGQ